MAGILTNNRKTGPSIPVVSTTSLTYDFPLYTDAELGVYTYATDGTITKLVLTTDYTVSRGDAHADTGGTITLVTAANGTDQYLLIGESVDGSAFQFSGVKIDQEAIDNEFYMLQEQIQEIKERLAKMVTFELFLTNALNDVVMPSTAGGFLQLTTIGDPSTLAFTIPTDITGVTTTAYTQSLLDDANAPAARTTLGVDSKVNTDAHAADAGAHVNMIMLDEPVDVVNSSASSVSWTDVDISSNTGSDTARIAILKCELSVDAYTSATNLRTLNMRENGKTPTQNYDMIVASDTIGMYVQEISRIFVPLDANEIFEYEITQTGFSGAVTAHGNYITLEGYIL